MSYQYKKKIQIPLKSFLFSFVIILLSFIIGAPSEALTPRVKLRKVLNIIAKGDYVHGSAELYNLSRDSAFKSKRAQIKYTLGIAFMEMELYHMASLQFIYVIKSGNKDYRLKALEKLLIITKYLNNDNLLQYTLNQISFKNIPITQRSSYYYYLGHFNLKDKKYNKSRYYLFKIKPGNIFYNKARYLIALSYAEENKTSKAIQIFKDLSLERSGITDSTRIAALMGLARTYYQAKKFKSAIRVYRSIPKDTPFWHESLLENSWAFLRAGKFRSALSNFQTLHSHFYAEQYQPESLILRSYTYLYICKYYEMEKVLDLFNATYLPTLKKVKRQLLVGNLYTSYFNVVFNALNRTKAKNVSQRQILPPVVINKISKNAKFQSSFDYLKRLEEEQRKLNSLPSSWLRSRIGRNAKYILKSRISSTKKSAGKVVKSILLKIKKDLNQFVVSEGYLRYDILKGKREFLKKRIAKRHAAQIQIDEKIGRDYYVANGYEYWPFEGENWLDELGSYHYVGIHNCQ